MTLRSLFASVLLCAGLYAQTTAVDIRYRKFMLDNGLTVLVNEDHKTPIVAVNMPECAPWK